MILLEFTIEIKTSLLAHNPDDQKRLDEIQTQWTSFLDLWEFEYSPVRYSQGICDCDHVQHREWCYISISVKKQIQNENNAFHYLQMIHGYSGLFSSLKDIDFCRVQMKG